MLSFYLVLDSECEAVVPEIQQFLSSEFPESPAVATAPGNVTRSWTVECETEEQRESPSHVYITEGSETQNKTKESDWSEYGEDNRRSTPVGINESESDSETTLTPSPFFVVPCAELSPSPFLSPLYLMQTPDPDSGLTEQGAFSSPSERALYFVPTSPEGALPEEAPRGVIQLREVPSQAGVLGNLETFSPCETQGAEDVGPGFVGSTICEEGLTDLGLSISPFQSPARGRNHLMGEDFNDGLAFDSPESTLYSPVFSLPSALFESHSPGLTNVAASVEISTAATGRRADRRRRNRGNASDLPPDELPNSCDSLEEVLETGMRVLVENTNQEMTSPSSGEKRKRTPHSEVGDDMGVVDENVCPVAPVQLTPPSVRRPPGRPRKPSKKKKKKGRTNASPPGRATKRGKLRNMFC